MATRSLLLLALLAAPSALTPTLRAQSEAALKEYFEGRTVTVKIAMPGTEDGVDIHPGTDVDRLLGAPQKSTDRMEGRLKVTSRLYATGAGQVTAEFVEGVLIRFAMTSN